MVLPLWALPRWGCAECGADLLVLANAVAQQGAHLPAATEASRWVMDLFGDLGKRATNNAAERALRQSVIQRKISHGAQSRHDAICLSRLLTVITTLRQHGRDIWQFREQAWIGHHRGGEMPLQRPNP